MILPDGYFAAKAKFSIAHGLGPAYTGRITTIRRSEFALGDKGKQFENQKPNPLSGTRHQAIVIMSNTTAYLPEKESRP